MERERGISFLILRAFFAQFWALQFWFKLHDSGSGVTALRNLGFWARHTVDELSKTPLPILLLRPYTAALPWIELLLGLLFVLGLWQRAGLIASALRCSSSYEYVSVAVARVVVTPPLPFGR